MNNIENEKTAVVENGESMKDDNLFLINGYARLHEDMTIEIEDDYIGFSHKKYSKVKKEPEAKISFIYNRSSNTITCLKHNKKDGTNYKSYLYKFEKVKDLKTFLDWFDKVNEYCEKNNICYDTISENLNKSETVDEFINPKNPNLKLVRFKNNIINFVKDNITIDHFICNNINDSAKFIDYAKNTFQFCEENNFPFERYPAEIAKNMTRLQFGIYKILNEKYGKNEDIKILSKSFDKSGSTAFIYLSNGTVESCTYDDVMEICVGTIIKPFTEINNIKDFSNWIKNDVKLLCNWLGFSYADYNAIMQNKPDILFGVKQEIIKLQMDIKKIEEDIKEAANIIKNVEKTIKEIQKNTDELQKAIKDAKDAVEDAKKVTKKAKCAEKVKTATEKTEKAVKLAKKADEIIKKIIEETKAKNTSGTKITDKKTLQNITDATEEVEKVNSNSKELE